MDYLLDFSASIKIIGDSPKIEDGPIFQKIVSELGDFYSNIRVSQFTLHCIKHKIMNLPSHMRRAWIDAYDKTYRELRLRGSIRRLDESILSAWSMYKPAFEANEYAFPDYRAVDYELTKLTRPIALSVRVFTCEKDGFYSIPETNIAPLKNRFVYYEP